MAIREQQSVPHGKLVPYKSYIYVIKIFKLINKLKIMTLFYLHLAWLNYGLDVLNIFHAYRSANIFNECLCVVLGQSLWLDEIASVTMGSCTSKILNEF